MWLTSVTPRARSTPPTGQPSRPGRFFGEDAGRLEAVLIEALRFEPKHLGAQIGMTLVLHTWGSALTHHPHVHGIVPGGGLSPDGQRWVSCKSGFFLSVRVLSRLFRRRFLEELEGAHRAGKLQLFGQYSELHDARAFARWLAPVRKFE